MQSNRFQLEKYNRNNRYNCPQCGKAKEFTRYIDVEDKINLPEWVGICNRRDSCGYHYTPKQFFEDNPQAKEIQPFKKPIIKHSPIQKQVIISAVNHFIPIEIFNKTVQTQLHFEQNRFIRFLNRLFNHEDLKRIVETFYIGNSKHWEGATVFWQIDINKKIRTGQVILYDELTGKRVKEPYKHIDWVHSILKKDYEKQDKPMPEWLDTFQLSQCLFGEHQLCFEPKDKPIAIVEAPKTAVIATAFYPSFIWLAVNGISNLNVERCSVLKGRKISLFPDLNAYSLWLEKAKQLQTVLNTPITVSKLLEDKATDQERAKGLDLADYLIRFDKYSGIELTEYFYPKSWDN